MPVADLRRVFRPVERRTDVVRHPSIDRYVVAYALDAFVSTDLIDCHRRWSDQGAPRFDSQLWQRHSPTLAGHLSGTSRSGGPVCERGFLIALAIRDSKSATWRDDFRGD